MCMCVCGCGCICMCMYVCMEGWMDGCMYTVYVVFKMKEKGWERIEGME